MNEKFPINSDDLTPAEITIAEEKKGELNAMIDQIEGAVMIYFQNNRSETVAPITFDNLKNMLAIEEINEKLIKAMMSKFNNDSMKLEIITDEETKKDCFQFVMNQ